MTATERIAVVLCRDGPTANDAHLTRVLDFFGIRSVCVSARSPDLEEQIASRLRGGGYCLFATVAALAEASPGADACPSVVARAAAAFVCGFDQDAASERWLRTLAADPSAATVPMAAGVQGFSICRDQPDLTGPMSGVTATKVNVKDAVGFRLSADSRARPIVQAQDATTCFLRSPLAEAPIFVASAGIEIDVDAAVDGNYFDVRKHFLDAIPLVMFVTWAYQDTLFRTPHPSASLVVDDPVLRPRYGALDFSDVLGEMREHHFSTTIAFIPWNWRRTREETARMFVQNPQMYSVVVHGNDHTSREFDIRSTEAQGRKIRTATHRMRSHERRTGVQWSPIMVFPQGVFSRESMYALKISNYIAAVNTEINPSDAGSATTIREAWGMAIMSFSSFPLFTRRYTSHGIENFAFDLLLGKPCIVVVHHDAFEARGRELIDFLDALGSLNCALQWRPLRDTVVRSYRVRRTGDDSCAVQMVANELVLSNDTDRAATYHFSKPESGGAAAVASVTVDGHPIAWNYVEDELRFSAQVAAGQSCTVRIQYASPADESLMTEGMYYQVKCAVRRILSEVRDDYISRSVLLSKWTEELRRHLR